MSRPLSVTGPEGNELVRRDLKSNADTVSGSGGLVFTGAGADSLLVATPTVKATVSQGATVEAGDDVTLLSLSGLWAETTAKSTAVGLIGGGQALSTTRVNGEVASTVDGTVKAADQASVLAVAGHTARSRPEGFVIGIGGVGVTSVSETSPTVTATVGKASTTALVQAGSDAYVLAIADVDAVASSLSSLNVALTPDASLASPKLDAVIGQGAKVIAGDENVVNVLLNPNVVRERLTVAALVFPNGVSVVENSTYVATLLPGRLVADTVTLTLAESPDRDRFAINPATGDLTFKAAPDFEAPADANGDNVYEVAVLAQFTKGGSTTLRFRVRVTDVAGSLTTGLGEALGTGLSGAAPVTAEQVRSLAASAVDRWKQTGLTGEQQAALGATTFRVADLAPGRLAVAAGSEVLIDRNADGRGWFVDATPGADEEFGPEGPAGLTAVAGGPAVGLVDLLTVLMHELGHLLGIDHAASPLDVMFSALGSGVRRLPASGQADGSVPGQAGEEPLFATGDRILTIDNLGTRYERIMADVEQVSVSGPAPIVRVEATVTPTLRINVGTGSVLQSGSNKDVVILVESNHTATAVGGGFNGIPAPLGVIDARATVGGSIEVFIGGTINHGGDLTLELHTANRAVAIGSALAVGPFGGTGINTMAQVTPTISTYVAPSSNITVGGDFTIRTLSEGSALAESRGIAGATDFAVGVSLASAKVAPTVSTYIGSSSTINAGGSITVETLHNVNADGEKLDRAAKAVAEASAGSLKGSGAGADADADASPIVKAYVDSGASLSAGPTGTVTIHARSHSPAVAETGGIAIAGILSVGAALSDAHVGGSTEAYLAGNVNDGKHLVLDADATGTATAHGKAVSGGILTGAGSDADASASPTVKAYVGNGRTVDVSGDVSILASNATNAVATADGVAGGGVGVGASLADATAGGTVEASIGGAASLTATNLTLLATDKLPTGTNSAHAIAKGSTGALIGVAATVSNASNTGSVTGSVGNGAMVTVSGATGILADHHGVQVAEANAAAGGILAVGYSEAKSSSDADATAKLGTNVLVSGGSLVVSANGDDENKALTTSGSGGVVSGNGVVATTADTSSAAAQIGQGTATVGKLTGTITVEATHNSFYTGSIDAVNASALGASGSKLTNTGQTSASVDVGDDVDLSAAGVVRLTAANRFTESNAGTSISAGAGGGLTATAAVSDTDLVGTATVTVGDNAEIHSGLDPNNNPGGIVIVASGHLLTTDLVKLQTGGAIQGAGVESSLDAVLNNRVEVRPGARLESTGNVGVGTFTRTSVDQTAEVETWGLAAVGAAKATANVTTNQGVEVGTGATLEAVGNVNLTPGRDPTGAFDTVVNAKTSAQGYVRGLVAVPVAIATTNLASNADLKVNSGATARSGQNVTLGGFPGVSSAQADGTGRGYQAGFVPVIVHDSRTSTPTTSTLTQNGTVVAGTFNTLDITIPDARDSGIFSTQVQVEPGGTPFTHEFIANFDPRAFVAQNFTGTPRQLLENGTSSTPVGAMKLGPLFAAGGTVTVNADSIQGSGSITAQGSPTIRVINHSPDYLILDSVRIPNLPGGRVTFSGAADAGDAGSVTIQELGAGGSPLIEIHNAYQDDVGNVAFGPAIFLTGTMENLGGVVRITNDTGSLGEAAPVLGQQVNITVPQGVFVAAPKPGEPNVYFAGGNPFSEWDDYQLWPGGNPALGVPSARDALQWVANYEHQDAGGSTAELNRDIYGFAGDRVPDNFSTVYYGGGVAFVAALKADTTQARARQLSPVGQDYRISDSNFDERFYPVIPVVSLGKSADNYSVADLAGSRQSLAIFGGQVAIVAGTIDINGRVEAGQPTDWTLNLPAAMRLLIDGHQFLWDNRLTSNPVYDLPVSKLRASSEQIKASYDARTRQITISRVRASSGGGYVFLDGGVVNSNALGNIHINGGLGTVEIDNQTGIPLVVDDIYTGRASATRSDVSRVEIIDRYKDTSLNHTLYVYTPGQGVSVYRGAATDTALEQGTPVSTSAGSAASYSPKTGLYWEWEQEATLSRTVTNTPQWTVSDWTWTFPAGQPNNPWQYRDFTTGGLTTKAQGRITEVPGLTSAFHQTVRGTASIGFIWGITYGDAFPDGDDILNFGFRQTGTNSDGKPIAQWDYKFPNFATLTMNSYVKADNPIAIDFSGSSTGLVRVTSNASVTLNGQITNPDGDTTVQTTGDILATPDVTLLTNDLTLLASRVIGGTSGPLTATLTDGGVLTAEGGPLVNLKIDSAVVVHHVTAGSAAAGYGVVVLAAAEDVTRATGSPAVNVTGRNIHLTSERGGVGEAAAPLVLQAVGVPLPGGGTRDGRVDVLALDSVALKHVGDLRVGTIRSGAGDVAIESTGGVFDARGQTSALVLDEAQLREVWNRLRLTAAAGAAAKAEETVQAFEALVDRNYREYWALLARGTVTGGVFLLDDTAIPLFRARAEAAGAPAPATDAQVRAYAAGLFGDLVAFFDANLAADWRTQATFQAFDPAFAYDATATQEADLTKNSVWSEAELRYAVNQVALEPSAGTVGQNAIPNVVGRDVSVKAAAGVGTLAASLFISLADLTAGTLTDEQAAALAVANSPGAVSLVGRDVLGNTVDFALGQEPPGVTIIGVRVLRTSPLFVNASGTVDAEAGGVLYLQATSQNLSLGRIRAGDDVSLTAPGSIVSAGTEPVPIETGGDLTLLAGSGNIGAGPSDPLTYKAAGTLLSAAARQDLDLKRVGGDFRFLAIFAGDEARLTVPEGSLIQQRPGVGVVAHSLDLDVSGSVGGTSGRLGVELSPSGQLTGLATGSALIGSPNGSLVVGDFTARENADFLVAGDLTAVKLASTFENVTLAATGDVLLHEVSALLRITVSAGVAIVDATWNGTGTRPSNTPNLSAADAILTATTAGGDPNKPLVTLVTALEASVTAGGLWLANGRGLVLGGLSGNPGINVGTFAVVSAAGAIADGQAAAVPDVRATTTVLRATGAIGSDANPLETATDRLEAVAGLGGLWVSNAGALQIGGAADDLTGLLANGPIRVETSGGLTVKEDVVATWPDALVTLTATDSAMAGDDLALTDGARIDAYAVTLQAGDDLRLDAGTSVRANTTLALRGDHGDTDAAGTRIDLDGHLAGRDVFVQGGAGDDVITLDLQSLAGHTRVQAGAGADEIVVDQLPPLDVADRGLPGRSALGRDTLDLDGQEGGDAVRVVLAGAGTDVFITVADSGTSGDDHLTVVGTDLADLLLLRASAHDTAAGGVAFVAALHGSPTADVERVNYDHSVEKLTVDARGGDDVVIFDDNWVPTTVRGGAGDDRFQVGQVFESARDALAGLAFEDEFATTATTRGFLSNGVSFAATLDGEGGADAFTVFHNLAALDLRGGSEDDNFAVRAFPPAGTPANGPVAYLANAPVAVHGGGGSDGLELVATEFADQLVVTAGGVVGVGVSVSHDSLESLLVDAAEGDDEVYVLGTSPDAETHLLGGLGGDRFSLGGDVPEIRSGVAVLFPATAGPHTTSGIGNRLLTIDGAGGLGALAGSFTAVALPGEDADPTAPGAGAGDDSPHVDALEVYDDATTAARTVTLTVAALTGLGMDEGLAYANLEALELFLGNGADEVVVTGATSRADGYRTLTAVNTGGGDDTATITLDATADSFFVLNAEAGNDVVNAASSTLGVVAFGGEGDDEVSGGTGDDLLFGDRAVVDYRDAAGTLVTRLGLGLSERIVLLSGEAESSNFDRPFRQTDGVVRSPSRILTRDSLADVWGGVPIDVSADVGADFVLGSLGPVAGGDDRLAGGEGQDLLFGQGGDDRLAGDAGHDFLHPGEGRNEVNAGAGNDQVYAGFGKDAVEARAGVDVIEFFGTAGGDEVTLAAAGGRLAGASTATGATLDAAGFEQVTVHALAGADTVTLRDLAGLGGRAYLIDLGAADAAGDRAIIEGSENGDYLAAAVDGSDVVVTGRPYAVRIEGAEADGDRLTLRGLGGDDRLTVAPDVLALLTPDVEAGAGDDSVTAPTAILGDAGGDAADFTGVDGPVAVNLDQAGWQTVNAQGYAVQFDGAIEHFVGSPAEDQIYATQMSAPRTIDGGAGGAILFFDTRGGIAQVTAELIAVPGFASVSHYNLSQLHLVNGSVADVSAVLSTSLSRQSRQSLRRRLRRQAGTREATATLDVQVRNDGRFAIGGPITLAFERWPSGVRLLNRTGKTSVVSDAATPYVTVGSAGGLLVPGETLTVRLKLRYTRDGLRKLLFAKPMSGRVFAGGANFDIPLAASPDRVPAASRGTPVARGRAPQAIPASPGDSGPEVVGTAGDDVIELTARGVRLNGVLVPDTALDAAGFDRLTVRAGAGADTVLVHDLAAVGAGLYTLDLGDGDAAVDRVFIEGGQGDDLLAASSEGGDVVVTGLPYAVRVRGAEAADRLALRGLGGDDRLTATPGVASLLTLDVEGGSGNDTVTAPAPVCGDGGADTLDLSGVPGRAAIDLDAAGRQEVAGGGYAVQLADVVENFVGTASEDRVRAGALPGGRVIDGGGGGAVLEFDARGEVARVTGDLITVPGLAPVSHRNITQLRLADGSAADVSALVAPEVTQPARQVFQRQLRRTGRSSRSGTLDVLIRNVGRMALAGPLAVVFRGLPAGVRVVNRNGKSVLNSGAPLVMVGGKDSLLLPGAKVKVRLNLHFTDAGRKRWVEAGPLAVTVYAGNRPV